MSVRRASLLLSTALHGVLLLALPAPRAENPSDPELPPLELVRVEEVRARPSDPTPGTPGAELDTPPPRAKPQPALAQPDEVEEPPVPDRRNRRRAPPEPDEPTHFVRLDTEVEGPPPAQAALLAAVDVDATALAASRVTATEADPLRREVSRPSKPTRPRPMPRDRRKAERAEQRPRDAALVRAEHRPGQPVEDPGKRPAAHTAPRGIPEASDGERDEGEREQSEAAARNPTPPPTPTPGGEPTPGSTDPEVPELDAPEWWRPIALRVVAGGESTEASAEPPEPIDDPQRTRGVAPEQARERTTAATLGVRRDTPAPPDPSELETPVTEDDRDSKPRPADERAAAMPHDAPEELLAAELGLRAQDADPKRHRPMPPLLPQLHMLESTSPQAVLTDAESADVPMVAAAATPLGRWLQRVTDEVVQRWFDAELPVEERVIGGVRDVTVRVEIARSGRVRTSQITASSGRPTLDRLALQAVATRVPKIPREVGQRRVEHEITFHYRVH